MRQSWRARGRDRLPERELSRAVIKSGMLITLCITEKQRGSVISLDGKACYTRPRYTGPLHPPAKFVGEREPRIACTKTTNHDSRDLLFLYAFTLIAFRSHLHDEKGPVRSTVVYSLESPQIFISLSIYLKKFFDLTINNSIFN